MEKIMDSYKEENELLEKAIQFAVERHAGSIRKGTTRPYIVHPLETMQILISMKADTRLLIAGVLHDTVEDTATTMEEITELFGFDAAGLVAAHTEDKSKTWEERKQHAIEEVTVASRRVKMLVLADKVANLRSLEADYADLGEKLWERFHAPKERQAWYYGSMRDALAEMQDYPETKKVYAEMVKLCKNIFVDYLYAK